LAGRDFLAICSTVAAGIPVIVSAFADFNGQSGGGAAANCTTGGVDDSFASFSNYGAVVDIAVTGTCIYSTMRGGSYGYMSETSVATPHVTGAVALYLAVNPDASTRWRGRVGGGD
jgi:subtilisin